jgi:D-beta-D-heptose 7-phosphate kinase/D-beta-D-heptose 1-phosphate adenosyltransferase
MLGGAGNVARNVAAAGGVAVLVGVIGDDAPGREALRLVGQEGAIESHLVTDSDRPTTVKTRFSSGSQQLLRLDTEATHPIEGDIEAGIVRAVAEAARDAGAILLSDYGKGVVTPAVIAACARVAAAGTVLIVDSKARGFARYGAADVVKPNAAELGRATDLAVETDADIEIALIEALTSCEARAILVTRAAKGMSLAVRGEPVRHFSRPPPEVFDTAGAGDTALAVTGLALAAGADLPTAIELALIACGVVVEKAGVATASADEMIHAERAANLSPHDSKITTLTGMVAQVGRWRAQGLKVGFTNGCFDILHPGHVSYLAQARSWCDRLVVGLNTDRSVRAAKGPGRPVNDLASRAAVLAALSCVDLVVAFDEATPIRLIEAAKPDLLVKGADYTVDRVVGGDLVRGWGGEVRLAAFVDGHSTTATLLRAAEG